MSKIISIIILMLLTVPLISFNVSAEEIITQQTINNSGFEMPLVHTIYGQGIQYSVHTRKITRVEVCFNSPGDALDIIRVGISETLDEDTTNWETYTQQFAGSCSGWESFDFSDYTVPDTGCFLMVKHFEVSGTDTVEVATATGNPYSSGWLYGYYDGSWDSAPGNTRDLTFRVYGEVEEVPVGGSIIPENGETGCYLQENLQVGVTDANGDNVAVQFKDYDTGATIGNDIVYGGSGTASTVWSDADEYSTTYRWYTNLNDGYYGVRYPSSGYFDFTTKANPPPVLEYGDVDPNSGDVTTTFTFEVRYRDEDGEPPGNHKVWASCGGTEIYQTMNAGSGTYTTGKWYDYDYTGFPDGAGEYYFYFDDGTNDVRLPASGTYAFTVSTNHAPDNIPLYNITTFPTSFYRDELVLFNATTADQDGDQIKYGWDFNFDGTVDDWSDYYTSSVTSTVNFTYPIARNYSDSWNYTSGRDYNMTFSEDIWNHNTSIGANDTCENFLQQGDIYDDIDYIFRKNLTDDSWDSWIRDDTWNTVTNIDSYEDCPQYEYSFHMITILDNMTFVNNSGGDDFLINFSLDSSTSSNLTFDPSIFMFNDSLCSNNTPENFCKQIGVWDELSYIDCPADSQLWSKSGSGSLTEIVAWKTYKISLINYSGITINSLSVDYDAYPTSLPGWVQVKADDGNGGTTGWSDIVEITLDNYDPDSPALNGPSFLGLGEQGTWWLNVTDAEQDYMNVTILWGDGHDNHSGYVANGTNVSFTHIYDSSDEKIITIQIKDVFLGLTTYYDSVDIQGVPSAPTSIDGTPYNQMIHVSWSPPTSDGGQQITTYSINYWNHTLGAGSAIWIHNISFDNASGGSRGGEGYNITGLDNGQQYDFLMTANNTYGRSDYSGTYNATPGHTPPTTPTLDALGQYEGTAFDLTWSEPDFYDSAVLDKYYVIYSTDNENYDALGNTTARTYHVSGMINGETYYFRVYAIDNQSGQSLNSDYSWTQIDDINPTWPILEDLPIYSYNTSITVSWSASTDATAGINYYRLEEDDSTSFDQSSLTNLYESVDDTARSYTFSSNHQFGKTYYYRVRAYDKAGNPSEWNGPVQTKLKSNETEGDEYSKITEIWFNQNSITINKPVVVTVSVEDRYTIPTDYVTMTVNGVETVMRLSSLRKGYYSFDATWEPDSSGEVDVQLKVINANNAANTVTVPVDVESSVVSRSPSIVIFENADDIIVATFSEDRLNVSAYLDEYNMYHASFTEQPDEAVVIDLTNLDAIMTSGHWWIFDISWLDALKLQCEVHGYTGIKHYRVKFTGATIEGYNDFWSTYFGWVLGQDFTLVVTDASYITVSSLENNLVVKY